jgi:hypothetical protein
VVQVEHLNTNPTTLIGVLLLLPPATKKNPKSMMKGGTRSAMSVFGSCTIKYQTLENAYPITPSIDASITYQEQAKLNQIERTGKKRLL